MDIVSILIIVEATIALIFCIWLILMLRRHVKHSPAEKALQLHLLELERSKANKKLESNENIPEKS